jgi:hypothetical protein
MPTRLITSFLFETAPHDPATLIGVVALVAAAAGVAAWLPARRAASVDPIAALRSESRCHSSPSSLVASPESLVLSTESCIPHQRGDSPTRDRTRDSGLWTRDSGPAILD